ncbi:MAG: hypothetical protein IJ719_07305 [Clostridia bacterium]|nr:hypothetical protein [Clostridia bacterium]
MPAISVDSDQAAIKEPVDVLFIGGALYAYGIDNHLKTYLRSLKKGDAKKAVVFSTSWLSKHSIDLIKKGVAEAGIPVEEQAFYLASKQVKDHLEDAARFAERYL